MNMLVELLQTPKAISKEDICNWEGLVKQSPDQIELEVKNYFAPGIPGCHSIYARELFIPKGVILTGKIHKYPQLNIMSKGKMRVLIDEKLVLIEAPFTIVSPAGTKRIAQALEDTVWVTIHATDETDLEVIEHKFIAQDEEEYQTFLLEHQQFRLPLG